MSAGALWAPAAAPGGPAARYGFDRPDAAALYGNELLVANGGGNSVTVLDAASGAHLATLQGARFGFAAPSAIEVVGGDVFVANRSDSSVTELAPGARSVLLVISGKAYGFSHPVALAADGAGHLFVLSTGGSLTELDAGTASPLAVDSGKAFGFDEPTAVASVGNLLVVANSGGNSVSEIDAATMAPVRTVRASLDHRPAFDEPVGIAVRDNAAWVTNELGRTLTEISGRSGQVMRVVPDMSGYLPSPQAITSGDGVLLVASPPGSSPMITEVVPGPEVTMPWMMCNTNGPYSFSNPQALVVDGADLWVINSGGAGGPAGSSLTEMSARSGKLLRVLR